MEVSALKHAGVAGTHGRSPLLRLQSDERLIALIRRGNHHAFEALMSRYQARLLSFCRHMLASREDAEDVLQEVFAAAFNAIQADDRPLNVRPWLYRIARNRSLNHLRRQQPIGVDSMDVHFAQGGESTADKVHKREEFRLLLVDVQGLPETQRTALLLREIDALSYDQIAEAMETTVPSVKSLLVRARVALAEAAEARLMSCAEVRFELGEVAEGLKKTPPPVRRHLKTCDRCTAFRDQLKDTNKALAAVFPVGAVFMVKQFVLTHLGTTSAAGGGASAAGTAGVGATAGTAVGTAAAGGAAGGLLSAGASALVTKAAAGFAAAAIVTAGAVEVRRVTGQPAATPVAERSTPVVPASGGTPAPPPVKPVAKPKAVVAAKPAAPAPVAATPAPAPTPTTTDAPPPPAPAPPKEQVVVDTTVLPTTTTPTTTPEPAPTTPTSAPGEIGPPTAPPPAPPAGEGGTPGESAEPAPPAGP